MTTLVEGLALPPEERRPEQILGLLSDDFSFNGMDGPDLMEALGLAPAEAAGSEPRVEGNAASSEAGNTADLAARFGLDLAQLQFTEMRVVSLAAVGSPARGEPGPDSTLAGRYVADFSVNSPDRPVTGSLVVDTRQVGGRAVITQIRPYDLVVSGKAGTAQEAAVTVDGEDVDRDTPLKLDAGEVVNLQVAGAPPPPVKVGFEFAFEQIQPEGEVAPLDLDRPMPRRYAPKRSAKAAPLRWRVPEAAGSYFLGVIVVDPGPDDAEVREDGGLTLLIRHNGPRPSPTIRYFTIPVEVEE